MDIVDTFNHLIPSDQLDDSLIVGQNLECEANNEFCPGIPLEDSLKNMLSDKDPMFGSASSQFNLLDSEDPAFQIAGMFTYIFVKQMPNWTIMLESKQTTMSKKRLLNSNNIEKSPDKPHPYPLKLHKPKQDLASIKNKKMVSGLQHTITKKPKPLQNTQPKLLNRDEKHVTNIVKDKKEQHGPSKPTPPQNKVESMHPTHSRPGQSVKSPEASGPEKLKVKKPEKLVHKQRSRTISIEEPELFIPDNAPVKKESSEEPPVANSEAQWDGCNSCGLCKKPHNNMFMVGCGRCDDWFHGDCVGLDLIKVREMEEEDQMYVCLKCCEEESKKAEPEPPGALKPEVKNEVQDPKMSPTKPRAGPSQSVPSGGIPAVRKVRTTTIYSKQDVKSKPSSSSKKPVSVEQIRRSVRDSLKEILTQRLKESNLNVSVEKAHEIAKKTERELFHLYKDTDSKYKNKYRSLTFNLKDTKNNVLFKKVLKGEISPSNLIRMSPEELASKELAAWRQRENRHTIEMIEKEQREAERRPITKITHKGEIEIESLEPVKAPETVEPVLPPKAPPVPLPEPVVTPEKKEEIGPLEKDTTAQHKSHLFDLHCKICTGRMAPPVEEAPTKVVKVATTVIRRQSTKAEETKNTTTPPPIDDDLHLSVLEESLQNAKLDTSATKDETGTFLAGLKSLWRGFLHMASVAKLVTKAFPVSGILDHLTEDLPDSIQIGGRIGPQIVWDYLEKIRATGTKEVCLIRFSPETEEDEISYTLLYAYFSSRKRFGVVSNNLKQVKDMYIIPLGATEKVPHQLVPFDGPGLENNRPNLLLGLIIRQRPKRDYISVESETRPAPEVKHSTVSLKETKSSQEEDEQLYLSSLTRPLRKEKDKPLDTTENAEEEDEPLAFEDPPASEEGNNQGAKKPRFLPGVLLGWGGILPPLPDVFGKSSPSAAADDSKKTPTQAAKTETSASGNSLKSPTSVTPRDRFLIKKKDVKTAKVEPEPPKPTDAAKSVPSTDTTVAVIQNSTITLKDKPPDVSTEVFLARLSTEQSSVAKGDAAVVVNEVNKTTNAESQNPTTTADGAKPLSGILKKSSAYSTSANEGTNEVLPTEKADNAQSHKTVCDVVESDPVMSVVSPTPVKVHEQTTTHTSGKDSVSKDDIDYLNPFIVQKLVTEIPLLEPDSRVTEPVDHHTSDATLPEEPPVSGSYDYPLATAGLSTAESQERNSSATLSSEDSSGQSKEYKRIEVRYTDHDRRHHRDSHHGKKSRHHDREREKYDRNHDDKYRDRSRHHGHSDDRHSEKRKDRHHSEDYRHKDKDKHRHRRDSDYENGRRSSRDSYS
uniref:PHD finger protein 3 n=1 Tax=Periophthalmus magnuspinnatus TaxID=409849 RepID=A0A3B4A026_9GOBI